LDWHRGFEPGECTTGTASTFWEARNAFEAAWKTLLVKRTDADFRAWRHQRAWTEQKYRRFDRGERMPSELAHR
jgi:hypothetical protein